MRLWASIIILLFLISTGGAAVYAEPAVVTAATTVQEAHTIYLDNEYPEVVKITHICVYFYKKPWEGVCQKLTEKKTSFVFQHNQTPADVQRVALFGDNLVQPKDVAACLVYYNYRRHSRLSLSNYVDYLVRVDYVTGADMVCSMQSVVK